MTRPALHPLVFVFAACRLGQGPTDERSAEADADADTDSDIDADTDADADYGRVDVYFAWSTDDDRIDEAEGVTLPRADDDRSFGHAIGTLGDVDGDGVTDLGVVSWPAAA